jgi:hypothetical protein
MKKGFRVIWYRARIPLMEDFLDGLNWSYVIVAIGIFMGCLLISLVLLYGYTKDRWEWGKPLRFLRSRNFLIVVLLVVVGVIVYPPLKRMSVVAYERKETARREVEAAREMDLRRSEKMTALGQISLGMKEEEILLLLGHPAEERGRGDGDSEYKGLVYPGYEVVLVGGVCRSVRTTDSFNDPESERGERPIYGLSCLAPYEPADEIEAHTLKGSEPFQRRVYRDNNLEVEVVRGSIRAIIVVDSEWRSKNREK